MILSSHDLSDGGLAVTLAESCIGTSFGVDVDLDGLQSSLDDTTLMYAESHSRFIVSVSPDQVATFESIMKNRAYRLGVVTHNDSVLIRRGDKKLVNSNVSELEDYWKNGLDL